MNALSEAREFLCLTLNNAGIMAFSTVPEVADPPFVAVGPSGAYVSYDADQGLNFGEALVHMRFTLVTGAGDNDAQADALDDLLLRVLALRFDLDPFSIESVDEPGRITLNGQPLLGVAVNLSAPINLGV